MVQGSHLAPGAARGVVASSPPVMVDGASGQVAPIQGTQSIVGGAFSPDGSRYLAFSMHPKTFKFGLQVYDAQGAPTGARREVTEGQHFSPLSVSNDGSKWIYSEIVSGMAYPRMARR
jgi:hypothetical protein